MERILVVEYNKGCASAIADYLRLSSPDVEIAVTTATDFTAASKALESTRFDRILARDYMGIGLRARHFNPDADISLYTINNFEEYPSNPREIAENIEIGAYNPPRKEVVKGWEGVLKFVPLGGKSGSLSEILQPADPIIMPGIEGELNTNPVTVKHDLPTGEYLALA